MIHQKLLRGIVAVGLLSVAGMMSLAGTCRASDDTAGSYGAGSSGDCRPACHYKCITIYVPRTVLPYTKVVTLYDHAASLTRQVKRATGPFVFRSREWFSTVLTEGPETFPLDCRAFVSQTLSSWQPS